MDSNKPQPDALRLPDVMRRVALAKSTIYEGMAKGWFPKNHKLGPKSMGWSVKDIDDWLAERRVTETR